MTTPHDQIVAAITQITKDEYGRGRDDGYKDGYRQALKDMKDSLVHQLRVPEATASDKRRQTEALDEAGPGVNAFDAARLTRQERVLQHIRQHPGITAPELAAAGLSATTPYRLVKAGLITTSVVPREKRQPGRAYVRFYAVDAEAQP